MEEPQTETSADPDGVSRWRRVCCGRTIWAVEAAPLEQSLIVEYNENVDDLHEHAALAEAIYDAVKLLVPVYDMLVVYGEDVRPFTTDEVKSAVSALSAHQAMGLRRLVRVMEPCREPEFREVFAGTETLGVPALTERTLRDAKRALRHWGELALAPAVPST